MSAASGSSSDHCQRRLVVALLALLIASASGCNLRTAKKEPEKPKPQEVLYVTPVTDTVLEHEEFTGRTAAVETVELRSRVSGYLDKVEFADGDDVKKGDVLFIIDDRPFVAEEARTKAAIAMADARAKRLKLQQERSEELIRKEAISQDEYETIKFAYEEAVASAAAAKASHDTAVLDLGFTKVRAPLSGRIGRKMIDVGNLVTADTTSLATIVPLEEMYVYFDMDERTLLRLRRLEQEGKMSLSEEDKVTVEIELADSADLLIRKQNEMKQKEDSASKEIDPKQFLLHGEIDFQDNQVDAATGTLRMRALVKNDKGLLSPGLFARIRYPIGKPSPSKLIPEESLGSDQGQPFVFVIGADNRVAMRHVELGPQVGQRRVIRKGVEDGDRIAVTGLQRLRRDTEVTPRDRNAPRTEATAGKEAEPTTTANKTLKTSKQDAVQ